MKSNVLAFPNRKKKSNTEQKTEQSVPTSTPTTPASPPKPLAGTKMSADELLGLAKSKNYNSGAILKSSDANPDTTKPYQFNELQALTQNLSRLNNLHSRLRFMLTELEGLVIRD